MRAAGEGITVAVIDSGANVPHAHLPGVAGGIAFDVMGEPSDDCIDRIGHGTAVASAIYEKAPGAELWIVKVFDRQLATSVPALIRAIDWAAERGVRLINLSLGTPNGIRSADLQGAVDRATARGCLLVAARRHEGRWWYPGCLDGAVGVELDARCPRERVRVERSADGSATVRASPYPRPIDGVPPERNLKGISFSVANATGCLAAVLAEGAAGGGRAAALTALEESFASIGRPEGGHH